MQIWFFYAIKISNKFHEFRISNYAVIAEATFHIKSNTKITKVYLCIFIYLKRERNITLNLLIRILKFIFSSYRQRLGNLTVTSKIEKKSFSISECLFFVMYHVSNLRLEKKIYKECEMTFIFKSRYLTFK